MNRIFAIYARQSIDKADSISIETQIERCLLEAGDDPHRVYFDRGYSGKNTDRPQFQAMLQAVKNGEISCVICYKLDRCSRSILDFTQLMSLFQQEHVDFISCTEKFDTATPMGRAMLNICVVFAQLERETIQQRITDAYHSRCKKGYYMGGRTPFGFSLVPCTIEGKKTSCYAILEEEAEIMRQMYSIYQEQNASLADVILSLNALGIQNPRRKDGLWIRPHISRMLKNPIYVRSDQRIYDHFLRLNAIPDNPREDFIGCNGCYLYKIGQEQHLVLAPHEGIVPSEVWLKCQKGSGSRKTDRPPKSWLTGELKCKKCGRAVVLKQTVGKNGRVYRYFHCSGALGKARQCSGFKAFPANLVEDALSDAIIERIRSLAAPQKPLTHSTSLLKSTLIQLADTCDGTEESLHILRKTLQNLQTQITCSENTAINPAYWDRIIRKIDHFPHLTPENMTKIADCLITRAELTDSEIVIYWAV